MLTLCREHDRGCPLLYSEVANSQKTGASQRPSGVAGVIEHFSTDRNSSGVPFDYAQGRLSTTFGWRLTSFR